MNKRWGSLSGKGQFTLNINLIQTPKECIEYVVMHELLTIPYITHVISVASVDVLDYALWSWQGMN